MLTWRMWTSCPQMPQPHFCAQDLDALLKFFLYEILVWYNITDKYKYYGISGSVQNWIIYFSGCIGECSVDEEVIYLEFFKHLCLDSPRVISPGTTMILIGERVICLWQ